VLGVDAVGARAESRRQLDAQRVGDLMLFLNVLWSGLLQTMGYMALLYSYIGWSVFGGLFIMLGLIPAQKFFYGLMYRYRKKYQQWSGPLLRSQQRHLEGQFHR